MLGVVVIGEDLLSDFNNIWDVNWNGLGCENFLLIDIVGVD